METERLIIRRFLQTDLSDFCELIRDKMASEYSVYDDQYPTDDAGLNGFLNYCVSTDEFLAVVLKENNRLIGFIALNRTDDDTVRNLGYCFFSRYHSKGYAYEAASEVIDYAKNTLNLSKLVSGTALDNMPSVNLLKKLNFIETGRGTGSFVNDADGNPITFTGCSYELTL